MAKMTEQRKRLERTQVEALVRDYQEQRRFGTVTVRFQDGVVQTVERTETMKM